MDWFCVINAGRPADDDCVPLVSIETNRRFLCDGGSACGERRAPCPAYDLRWCFYRSIYAAADADLDELDSDGIDAYSGDTSVHRHYRDVGGFAVAIVFGAADAFTWPASSAILPRLLPPELFPPGNSLVQGMGQLSQMLGPVLGGLIIAYFSAGDGMAVEDLLGISIVFYLDAFGFIIALISFNMMRLAPEAAPTTAFNVGTILQSSWQGVVATWNDFPVRMLACMFAVFALFFRGPYLVGIPMLAHSRFEDGALSFGLISSAFGVGALIGLLLAGTLRRPADHHIGLLLLADIVVLGIGRVAYAFTTHIEVAMLFSALSGVADGYVIVIIISFLQIRILQAMLGRVMSVIMIFNMGLLPLSAAVSGALIRISLESVLLGAGCILIGLALVSSMVPKIRTLGLGNASDTGDNTIESVDDDIDPHT